MTLVMTMRISQAIEDSFHIYIASSKDERSWENLRQLCKPLTVSRVCITVENSSNSPSV